MYHQGPTDLKEEKELVLRLQAGDEWAFEQLYGLYKLRILKKLIRFVKREDIAVELLQDIFLKLWEKRESLDPEQSFRSYLFRIAENKITDLFRRAAHDKKLLAHLQIATAGLTNTTEEIIHFKEQQSLLQEAIDSLPPQRQKIFILCKIEGKSYQEAAELLGISIGTVNDHMVKAGRVIRQHFKATDLVFLVLLIANLPNGIRP